MSGFARPGGIARRGWLRACAGGLAAGLLSTEAVRAAIGEGPAAAVSIDNFTFTPASVTIRPGTTITWTNHDDSPHVVVLPALKLRSPAMDTDQAFSHRFDAAGDFDYFCALHPYMKGRVIVRR